MCHSVHIYMQSLKAKGRIRMLYLTNDCASIGDTCVYFSGLDLYARYDR